MVRSIQSHKFNCDLQHNTFLGNIEMKVLWVLWASTKRKFINQLGDNTRTFRINEENKSFTYTVVFLHEQWKIDFCWIDHTRVVNIFLFFFRFGAISNTYKQYSLPAHFTLLVRICCAEPVLLLEALLASISGWLGQHYLPLKVWQQRAHTDHYPCGKIHLWWIHQHIMG